MKLIISIISANTYHYKKLKETQLKTWNNKRYNKYDTFYIYGDQNLTKLKNEKDQDLIFPCVDGTNSIGYKTLLSYQYFLENYDFDFLFRTNLSSYIDVKLLESHIENNDLNYDGIVGHANGIRFSSGSGYLLKHELIQQVLDNKNLWNHNLIDDVALGQLLNKFSIYPDNKATRFDTTNSDNIDPNFYHYRVKRKLSREKEYDVHYEIHKSKKRDIL